jgi:hypothetical protein
MRVFSIILFAFLSYLSWYLGVPSLNFTSNGAWGFLVWITILAILCGAISRLGNHYYKFPLWVIFPFLGVFVVWLFVGIGSSVLFHASEYRNLLGEPESSEFTKDVSPISLQEMRLVEESVAKKLGEKRLGEDPALGSVAQIGDFTLQSIRGHLYYVAPLEHTGFFRWRRTRYTTGYIKVSATNLRDVSLVQENNGKPIRIRYQQSAFFKDYLKRHIRTHGYRNTLFTDYQFEIDDEGNPWWIVTTYEKKVGQVGGADATGCLIINPETGDITQYSVNKTPSWVDRIQPMDFIEEQVNDWGRLIHGLFNWSNKDKLKMSPGSAIVYGEDGQCYMYTGITSVGADEGTVGFLMINTRTKEVLRYNRSGATEIAARQSAESKVQEKGYHASFPIPYNVNGIPTYFMSLLGADGLPKKYAMVSIQNYDIVATGDNIRATLRAYQRALTSSSNGLGIESGFDREEITTLITRIQSDISDGQSNYYMMLDGQDGIYRGSSDLTPEIPLSRVGDTVTISFDDAGQTVTQISRFDNHAIANPVSEAEIKKQEAYNRVDSTEFMKNEVQNAKQRFDNLSDEEKLELLEKK